MLLLSKLNSVFCDCLNCFIFIHLDDILIFMQSLYEHITHIRQVLSCLLETKLLVKVEKCDSVILILSLVLVT